MNSLKLRLPGRGETAKVGPSHVDFVFNHVKLLDGRARPCSSVKYLLTESRRILSKLFCQ